MVSQSWGGGRSNASGIPAGGMVTLAYTTTIAADAPAGAFSKTTITDRGGNVIDLWHDGAGHRLRSRQVVAGQAIVYDYSYNTDGQITGITYPAGNRLEARYDAAAANRLARGNLLEVRRVPDAARGCDALRQAQGRLSEVPPARHWLPPILTGRPSSGSGTITNPHGSTTTYTYDARGNLTQVAFPNVTVGPAAPQAASLSWTYNSWGQPLTFTNPEGHVTRYDYYTGGPATGYRQRIFRDSGGLNIAIEWSPAMWLCSRWIGAARERSIKPTR